MRYKQLNADQTSLLLPVDNRGYMLSFQVHVNGDVASETGVQETATPLLKGS